VIRVGTSGYSYSDWVGAFYPPGTRSAEMLALYAQSFSSVELNFTYYRMPDARTLSRMGRQVPPGFVFSVKAPGELTHEMRAEASEPFLDALGPLHEAQQLAAVLAQFPYRFKNELGSRRYLAELAQRLEGLPLVVELRHASWITDAVNEWLTQLGVSVCCVDMPPLRGLLPRLDWVTGPIGYVRFHGRNSAKWWQHEESKERYDYRYSDEELAEWVPRLRSMQSRSRDLFVYMNNHANGKATADAQRLIGLLERSAAP
jgi:uncharacterized protein YecE (DUF72 family)